MSQKDEKVSKFLSLVLRHKPETIGIFLDDNGWVEIDKLLEALRKHNRELSLEELKRIVETNDKKRFAFSDDGLKIRANQGHSVSVDLDLKPKVPPAKLYHGTAERNIQSIKEKGLIKGQRHHVHLSEDIDTAKNVGSRYGKPIILEIDAMLMHNFGIQFFQSENQVWLTESVKPEFIVQISEDDKNSSS